MEIFMIITVKIALNLGINILIFLNKKGLIKNQKISNMIAWLEKKKLIRKLIVQLLPLALSYLL